MARKRWLDPHKLLSVLTGSMFGSTEPLALKDVRLALAEPDALSDQRECLLGAEEAGLGSQTLGPSQRRRIRRDRPYNRIRKRCRELQLEVWSYSFAISASSTSLPSWATELAQDATNCSKRITVILRRIDSIRADLPQAEIYTGWLRYSAFCQTCHGTGGVGSAIAPDLAQALKSLDMRQFETIVSCDLKGNLGTGVMPTWGGDPNIRPYIENLWTYLSARADGALGPGRPQKLSK
jgi:mono/diheme cytochrome c family protein